MQNRRNFLKQASLMLAGGLVAPQLLSSCGGKSGQAAATASESSKYIGLQLYSLRDQWHPNRINTASAAIFNSIPNTGEN